MLAWKKRCFDFFRNNNESASQTWPVVSCYHMNIVCYLISGQSTTGICFNQCNLYIFLYIIKWLVGFWIRTYLILFAFVLIQLSGVWKVLHLGQEKLDILPAIDVPDYLTKSQIALLFVIFLTVDLFGFYVLATCNVIWISVNTCDSVHKWLFYSAVC